MGQQQLLLIILGVIIVATAIAVGLWLFQTGAETATRDAIINDITHIVGNAFVYYSRPLEMGGGSGSFSGYALPPSLNQTGNGQYDVNGDGDILVVEGTSLMHEHVVVELTLSRDENGWDYTWDWKHEGI